MEGNGLQVKIVLKEIKKNTISPSFCSRILDEEEHASVRKNRKSSSRRACLTSVKAEDDFCAQFLYSTVTEMKELLQVVR